MLYSLSGKITVKGENFVVLETAGIGFKVFIPSALLKATSKGKKTTLFCFLYPENMEIYGFFQKEELEVFEMLNKISGIGPKMAIKIMNGLDIKSLVSAILSGRSDLISKKTGVSPKTASKIILELKEKVKRGRLPAKEGVLDEVDVEDVLNELGYSKKDAQYAVSKVSPRVIGLGARVKEALRILAKK